MSGLNLLHVALSSWVIKLQQKLEVKEIFNLIYFSFQVGEYFFSRLISL